MEVDLSVYLVLDPGLCGGLVGMLRVTAAAVAGGVGVVQLRAPHWKKRQWLEAAQALLPVCHAGGTRLVINDQLDVALIAGADGVHLGQKDLPVSAARRLLGPDALIGLSANRVIQLDNIDPDVVDYLGVGPVYATKTKWDADLPCGIEGLAAMVCRSALPVVAIGGIQPDNAAPVCATGVAGMAVSSAVCLSTEPQAVSCHLRDIWQRTRVPLNKR